MLAAALVLLIVLLAVWSFAPGFFLLRRLPWAPVEKLCGSVGLSLALLYLVSWGIYVLWPGSGPPGAVPFFSATLIAAGLGWLSRRDIVKLFQIPRVRRISLGYLFLLGWMLLLLGVIRSYSGGDWTSDWLEHFERSLFFIDRFPVSDHIFPGCLLSARPPLMNVVAGAFLAMTGDRFENYQVVCCFLNLLLFPACCLMLPRLAGRRRTSVLPMVTLFAASPAITEHVTFTWTKAFTAFYVLLAIYFYLAGWSKRDGRRMLAAFLALSAGMLTHYSTGPYAVFLTLHFLVFVFWKRQRKWREAVVIAIFCGVFLATWFEWSREKYGVRTTLAANSSVSSSSQYKGRNTAKIAGNLYDSIIPVGLHNPGFFDEFQQPMQAGWIRDVVFTSYQTNVLFQMGLVGGPLALWLFLKSLRRSPGSRAERNFWLAMVPFVVVLGIASTGERDLGGAAHLTLLPIAALGLTLIASSFPWRRAVTALVIAGCTIDFALGVFLNVHFERLENTPSRTIFTVASLDRGETPASEPVASLLSSFAWENWAMKHKTEVTEEWLASISMSSGQRDAQTPGLPTGLPNQLQRWMREDDVFWHGWYGRHGGVVTFLGDHIARFPGIASNAAEGIVLAVMLCLMVTFARVAWRTSARPA
jgi:hypothetical protein